MDDLESSYGDSTRVRWATAQQAGPIFVELADRGILERGDISELNVEDHSTLGLYKDGVATGQLTIPFETETHAGKFVVRPELNEAYATVRPLAGGDPLTVRSENGDVTTQACYTDSKCSHVACSSGACSHLERSCCDPCITAVTGGDVTEQSCTTSCGDWSYVGCCSC